MCARRRHSSQNGEIPLSNRGGSDLPDPAGRIDMGGAPEIDIANDQLGALFVERRRALGLKVEEIAEDIKIKTEYLKAIEREEFDLLPTPQYARLFVRAYAERLGFNTNEVYALLDVNMPGWSIAARPKHSAPPPENSPLSSPLPGTTASAPPDSRRRPRGGPLLIGIIGIAIVLAIIAWMVLGVGDEQSTGDAGENQSTSQAALGGGAVAGNAPVETALPETNAASAQTSPAETNWDTLHLVLTFEEETWASLVADGDNIANTIFKPGSTLEANGTREFRLSLGHTVGVSAMVNGRPLKPFRDWADRLEGHLINRDSIMTWLITTPVHVDSVTDQIQSLQSEFVGPRQS
ncbi:MAG: hypothetical protein Kow0074_06360 [Candidatus Zixiibacteriota bacterium]